MKNFFFTLLIITTSMIAFADDHKEKKDVDMKKGNSVIRVSQDFVDHYTKLGYQILDNKKNISVAKETEKIIKDIKKTKE